MESPTSFDLNLAIEQWRENLAQSPALRRENLDELESHLRDSTATLQTRGLSAEEAFLVAAKRTGISNSLNEEFAKVNGQAIWLDRLLWMLIGAQVCMMLAALNHIFHSVSVGGAGRMFELIPGMSQPAYWALVLLLPPLVLAEAVVVAWRRLRRSEGKVHIMFADLLNKPLKLAVLFFLLCICFKLFEGYVTYYGIYGNLFKSMPAEALNWKVVVSGCLTELPVYLACAALVLFFARKRLRTRTA
jgi:hypothetical protein